MRLTGRLTKLSVAVVALLGSAGCEYQSRLSFPNPNEVFMTTGDGDIQKPYTPIGQLFYVKQGFRLPVPVLGLLPIADVVPDQELRGIIVREVKSMGGDGVINLGVAWTPPSGTLRNLVGLGNGGAVIVTGTVIKR